MMDLTLFSIVIVKLNFNLILYFFPLTESSLLLENVFDSFVIRLMTPIIGEQL